MFKKFFLLATVSFLLSQAQAGRQKVSLKQEDDYANPTRTSHTKQERAIYKLQFQLETWQNILANEKQSNGPRRNKSRKIDYAWTRVQELDREIQRFKKFISNTKIYNTKGIIAENEELRRVFANPHLKINQQELKRMFPQPLMDTFLFLASPFGRNPEHSYLSHHDIFSLMEALYALEGGFVQHVDWGKDLFFNPSMSDDDLKKEGLNREDYDFFLSGIQRQFRKEVVQIIQSLKGPIPVGTDPQQVGILRVLRGTKSRFAFIEWMDDDYGAYKRFAEEIQDMNPLEFRFELLLSYGLTMLPPSLSRLTGLQILDLSCQEIMDVSAIAALTRLQELNLGGNQITDVSPIAALTGLQKLNLGSNQITDVRGLRVLTRLQKLNLKDNQLTDVKELGVLTSLQYLSLAHNEDLWLTLPDEDWENDPEPDARIAGNEAVVQAFEARGGGRDWGDPR